jgi:hypothetical protein
LRILFWPSEISIKLQESQSRSVLLESFRIGLLVLCLLFGGSPKVGSSFPVEPLTMEWNVAVTPPPGRVSHWFEMKVDPEDSDHLIVCGTEWNAQQNAFYGVVYVSHNTGRDWRVAMEDHATSWVTEHSCAFGRRHTAFFVSEASKVIDGDAHHDLGTTRIFRSSDSGETWSERAQTGWADFSVSAVAPIQGGSDGQRLYVFYNGDSKYSPRDKLGSTVDFFSVSEDGRELSQRQTFPGMAERNYQGVYPSSTAVLKDGTVVVLFNANRKVTSGSGIRDIDIGVVRLTSQGMSAPSLVASPSFKSDHPACPGSLSNSLAYDERQDLLYVAYNDISYGHCALLLTRSNDHGSTWSRPAEIFGTNSATPIYFPILAVNRDGILGLLSRGKSQYSPDCWYFSTLRDGKSQDDTIPLAPCLNLDSLSSQSSAYLMTHIRQSKLAEPARLDVLTIRDYLSRVSMISTADGAFHPIWSSTGSGFGELRTSAVRVGSKPRLPESHDPERSLTEVTDKFSVLYGGMQALDLSTNSIALKISLRNRSSVPVQGPLYLKAEDIKSDFGEIELVETPEVSAWNGYVEVSSGAGAKSLSPGEMTPAFGLAFHVKNVNTPLANANFVAKLKLRLFCQRRE